jgi:uncharacterized protein involved in exopolysaccharide biosynthesis
MDLKSDDDVSLTSRELRRVLKRGWRVMAASALLFGITAGIVGFLMTPVYRVSTILIPDETGERGGVLGSAMGQLGGLAAIAGLGFGNATQNATTEALAVLQSRQFLQEFIDENRLMPKLFPKEWDRDTSNWKSSLRKVPTPFMAYKRFSQSIMDVYQDKKTDLVTLVINWTDRGEAADWANRLVDMVNARMRERAIAEADQTIHFLQQELRGADTVEVRSAISSMMESQLKVKAVASVRKQYAFRVIDPAIAPDKDVVLRPHKGLYILIGTLVGLLLGVATVFLFLNRPERYARNP